MHNSRVPYLTCRWWVIGIVSLVASLATAVSGENLPIYTDHLTSGFGDWGWAPRSLTNASPVHSGSYSIAISAVPWAGVYLHHDEMNTRTYTNLICWAHGGESGGQILRIAAKLGTNDTSGYFLAPLPTNRWERYTVSLEFLGAANVTNFSGLMIQLRDECSTNTFYLDDLELEESVASSSLAPPGPEVRAPEPRPVVPQPVVDPGNGVGLGVWIAIGVGITIILLLWLVVTTRRSVRASSNALMPLVHAGPAASVNNTGGTLEFISAEDWRQRAIAAESVASKQAQILRENLMPELAEMAKHTLVQGLSSDRNALLETQRRAQQELANLESRLAALHLPLRERILVYEERISELEKELASRGEEMRELIRATLSLVRARLEEEKKKDTISNGRSA